MGLKARENLWACSSSFTLEQDYTSLRLKSTYIISKHVMQFDCVCSSLCIPDLPIFSALSSQLIAQLK